MALPKLNTPTYELVLPSTGEKIKYRPFLVKEQKVLLMAQESGDDDQIANAMGDIVASCTFNKVDSHKVPMFDIEYIFLKIRGKSVGETVELNITCPDDNKTRVKVNVNLEEINCHMTTEHTNEIKLSDDVRMFLRYPLLADMKGVLSSGNDVDRVFNKLSKILIKLKQTPVLQTNKIF